MLRKGIFAVVLLWAGSAVAQEPDWNEAISRLRHAATAAYAPATDQSLPEHGITMPPGFDLVVSHSADATESDVASNVYVVRSTNIPALIDQLDSLVQARGERPPESYVSLILHDQRLLDWAARTDDPVRRALLLEAVQGSLETRVTHLASDPVSYDVQLQVVILQDGRPAHGYRVGLLPIMWQGSEPTVVLNRESSPAEGEVMPGRYELVIRRGPTETRRSPYRIGLTGNISEVITVSVP